MLLYNPLEVSHRLFPVVHQQDNKTTRQQDNKTTRHQEQQHQPQQQQQQQQQQSQSHGYPDKNRQGWGYSTGTRAGCGSHTIPTPPHIVNGVERGSSASRQREGDPRRPRGVGEFVYCVFLDMCSIYVANPISNPFALLWAFRM